MKFAAGLDLLIGAALAWFTYELRSAFASPDAWLAAAVGLLAALMLISGAALLVRAAWAPAFGLGSSGLGLAVAATALVVAVRLLMGGQYQDVGGGTAKGALGMGLLLVFVLAFSINRSAAHRRPTA